RRAAAARRPRRSMGRVAAAAWRRSVGGRSRPRVRAAAAMPTQANRSTAQPGPTPPSDLAGAVLVCPLPRPVGRDLADERRDVIARLVAYVAGHAPALDSAAHRSGLG